MHPITVVALSESFKGLWRNLAVDLHIPIELVTDPAAAPAGHGGRLILAAGGAERQAIQWLEANQVTGAIVLVVGADTSRRTAMQCVARGARDYFALPGDLELLRNAVSALAGGTASAPTQSTRTPDAPPAPDGLPAFASLIGESQALKRELARAASILPHRNARVLILGETGTGKEVLARAIHLGGPRRDAPFVPVNCSALPEQLIESELFGHERGSFTDAHAAKPGLFEVADTGTLFLDEIGDLPLGLQAKLLRVLEDKQIRRVGATKSRSVDVRILAATNENLHRRVHEGTFREDLYFRLSTVVLTLPPLREREDDVLLIAAALLESLAAEHEVPVPVLTPEICRRLRDHHWPGNIRELKNSIERALLLSPPGELRIDELVTAAQPPAASGLFPFPAPLREINTAVAHATVKWFHGNRSEAARQLGISTKRLRRLLAGAADGDPEEVEDAERADLPT
ncbi:MAG: sigma-54 interaction domain-containing protein [Gemmatimonadales bacterium]